jgi:N6-adenosine-specific RNA methylase IME4
MSAAMWCMKRERDSGSEVSGCACGWPASACAQESPSRYRTIVADPPWPYEGFAGFQGTRGTDNWRMVVKALPYRDMSIADIQALPVASVAADDCRLFLWSTSRYLYAAFPILAAWGFVYKQTLVWHKTGRPFPHGGSVAPNHAEFLLVAVKGAPPVCERLTSSVIAIKRPHRHSQKPEAFLDLVEQVSPGPYLELFARRQRLGWDTWGDESLQHVEMSS